MQLAAPAVLFAQAPEHPTVLTGAGDFPEAPSPQTLVAAIEPSPQSAPAGQQTPASPPPNTQQAAPGTEPAPSTASQGSSGAQQPAAESSSAQPASSTETAPQTQEELRRKAEEQLKQQETQRVMGVMATFNTTRNKEALPLSPGQKFQLFFKSATDPWAFLLAGAVSGIGQANNDEPVWGQGAQGYAKRFGANYSDYFIGNFFGNAVLPSLLHEDPRYFQKGTGSVASRIGWAATSTVWCKRDRGGWGPNWSNVVGNLIGTAIGRTYYPAAERTVTDTITDGLTVTAEGIVGSEVIEFWPDMVRAYRRKHAEKLARQAAQKDAQSAAPPASQPSPAAPPKSPPN